MPAKNIFTNWKLPIVLAAIAALSACGGGDDHNPLDIDSIKVVGDGAPRNACERGKSTCGSPSF